IKGNNIAINQLFRLFQSINIKVGRFLLHLCKCLAHMIQFISVGASPEEKDTINAMAKLFIADVK
ncbi:hypothetical protein, partial [Pontibacter rugosus]